MVKLLIHDTVHWNSSEWNSTFHNFVVSTMFTALLLHKNMSHKRHVM